MLAGRSECIQFRLQLGQRGADGQTASHLPQRTQWLAFSASGKRAVHWCRTASGWPNIPSRFQMLKLSGMSTPMGQGIQYRQPVQPILMRLCRMRAVSATAASSAAFRGRKGAKVERLSASCSSVLMPERIRWTFLWLPTQRSAQEAALAAGSRAVSGAAASGGRLASVPPLMGSMMMSGMPSSSVSA